jgi:RNA polymerase sigma-70 factor (ECF subfamily)
MSPTSVPNMNVSGSLPVCAADARASRPAEVRATLPVSGSTLVNSQDLDSLMTRLADGDRAVFSAVFRELWPKVRGLCLSLLRNSHDAEDAAQQAMEKVLTRASDYDRTRPALPWALAIAAWECRSVARWRERRREVQVDQAATRTESAESTEEQFIRDELYQAASTALGELSEGDRAALVAAYWEESRSGTAAARKRRQRALERIRIAFRRLYGSD